MVQHTGAGDLIKSLAELADLLDRQPMEIEVSQAVFLLKLAGMTEAGFADVDGRDVSVGLAQRIDGSLGGSAAGDQYLSIWPVLLRGPHQQGQCPTPIGVVIELAVPIEVAKRRRIRVALVESAHRVISLSPLAGRGLG